MKIKKIHVLAFVLVTILAITGCTTNDTGLNTRDRNLSTQTRINDTRWNTRDNRMNTGTNDFDTNNRLNTGVNDFGPDNMLNNTRDFADEGRNDLRGNNLNNDLTDNNVNDNLNNGMTRPNTNLSTNVGNLTNNANDIAKKITDLPEVDKATVVLTNDTALVGCSLRGTTQGTMTTALRQKIEKIVKDKTNVAEISVTTDPDLYTRIDKMSTNIGNGNPIEGFAEEIRDLIRRITPGTNNRTTR